MITKFSSIIIALIIFSFSFSQSGLPRVFSAEANKLFSLREDYLNGKLKNHPAIKYLHHQADKLLDMTPLSVIDKKQIPPSGDKHDYMSMGKYWWPNPDTKDGLPYIRKDGEVNPEVNEISDATNIKQLSKSVEILSIAYYITNDTKYSSKAAQLLRVWFLDQETRMNPNLNFAQFIPGISEGRGVGIIDLHNFYQLIDAIGLLENSTVWTKEDDIKIKKWFDAYLIWLKTSKNGLKEAAAKNNHGTWYDVQIISYLFFLDRKEEAKEHLQNVSKRRIASQINADGKQPEELARTNGMSYTLFNLKAHFQLAVFGDLVGVDLWNYKTENSGSIRQALDYFLPYVLAPETWEYQQISEFNKPNDIYPILVLAKKKYDENLYSDWIKKIIGDKEKINIESFL